MKAPDKIYTDNRGVYAELPIFSQIDANVEYIRKDALLKWLEYAKTIYNMRGANAFELLTLQMIIEHINEM